MYRVRSVAGIEVLFTTLEEFSTAVLRGDVTGSDEIFHSRANRWLSVQSHPHYRTIMEGGGRAEMAGAPAPRPPAPDLGLMQSQSDNLGSATPPASPAISTASPAPVAAVPPAAPPIPPRPPRVQRTREVTFLDLGTPDPPPRPKPAPSPAPTAPAPPGRDAQFLVMDMGLEAPARDSSGARADGTTSGGAATEAAPDQPTARLAPVPLPPPPGAPLPPVPPPAPSPPPLDASFLVEELGLEAPVRDSRGKRTEEPLAPPAPAAPPPLDVDFLVAELGLEAPARDARGQRTDSGAAPPPTPAGDSPAAGAAAPAEELLAPPAPEEAPVVPQLEGLVRTSEAEISIPESTVGEPEKPSSGVLSAAAEHLQMASSEAPAAPAPARALSGYVAVSEIEIPGAAILTEPAPKPRRSLTSFLPRRRSTVARAPRKPLRIPRQVVNGTLGLLAAAGVIGGLLQFRPWERLSGIRIPALGGGTETPPELLEPAPRRRETPATPSGFPVKDQVPMTEAPARDSTEIVPAGEALVPGLAAPPADLGLNGVLPGQRTPASAPSSDLVARLEAAEALALKELEGRLTGFQNLFSANGLSAPAGITQARTSWNRGADDLRQFRARMSRLERAYEDSVLVAQRARTSSASDAMRAWGAHQSMAEPPETSQQVDLMFAQVNQALELLAGSTGQYQARDGMLVFRSPALSLRYTAIRVWVDQQIQGWRATPQGMRPRSVAALLNALGSGLPPAK